MEVNQHSLTVGGPRADPDTGLEESMWRLGLSGVNLPYPERPGEPDCSYYMRTGSCSYGPRCRFNHPRDRGTLIGAGAEGIGSMEYLERVDQPVCEYYMKTGTCKFGAACKYYHPRQGGFVQPMLLNDYGYPLRPGEKECSYYLKTGQCKFGSNCKFHHPQHPGTSVLSSAPAFYTPVPTPPVPLTHQYTPMANWQVARPPVVPGSYMPGPYAPMMLSPGVVPVQNWSPYLVPMSPAVSHGNQRPIQVGQEYGLANQATPTMPAYHVSHLPVSTSVHRDNQFPERSGQPECQFYMRTGDCKFGSTCKYHHPPDWSMPRRNCVLSPLGFPLRAGVQICSFYAQNGICKFGKTCKFDHPMGSLSYSPSASSLSDMPVAPYPIGMSVATLVPSLSSSELQFLSSKESFSMRMSSSNTFSDSVGSIHTNRSFPSPSPGQPHHSTSSSSIVIAHDSEISSSS
ncbi:zinc finger CCCH domain-containing protein 6-like [Zingiber officinale]|uniref:C3H1-type domain-containing protein n=1 Tax=Zingiber officinale TaxID=94328 RepID=A0A8J5KP36_ZINOF|nr:zinc finger CCCH domain-containing protein 6-like [Zingiber officinale]KAG6483813.1 hypothetical protein ZIOFF_060513 [Zingiber officinale]